MTCADNVCAGFIPSSGSVTALSAVAGPVPLSAYGCNGRVCINLAGSGLTVNSWETTAEAYASDGLICNPTAYFKAKGPNATSYHIVDIATIYQCHQMNGLWFAYFENKASSTWQNNTKLGNAWDPNSILSGFPTELVHT